MHNLNKNYTFAPVLEVFVAQLVEQMTLNHWVQGSSPCEDTTEKKRVTLNCVTLFFMFMQFYNPFRIFFCKRAENTQKKMGPTSKQKVPSPSDL